MSLAYGPFGGKVRSRAYCLCLGMVLIGVSRAALRPHPRQSNSPSSRDNRGHKENKTQTGREASWLKQVRKVKRVGKSEKWVTRPRGGRSKKNFGEKHF